MAENGGILRLPWVFTDAGMAGNPLNSRLAPDAGRRQVQADFAADAPHLLPPALFGTRARTGRQPPAPGRDEAKFQTFITLQTTLVLSLVTGHGRAAPLIWLSVRKEEIATRRNEAQTQHSCHRMQSSCQAI